MQASERLDRADQALGDALGWMTAVAPDSGMSPALIARGEGIFNKIRESRAEVRELAGKTRKLEGRA